MNQRKSWSAALIVGCATIRGIVMGAGVGYVLGDAEYGAQVGATARLIRDIWNRLTFRETVFKPQDALTARVAVRELSLTGMP